MIVASLARVGDVARQIRGVTYNKAEASRTPVPGSSPVVRAGNITDEGLNLTEDLVWVPSGRIAAEQRIRSGDVLIAASSGSLNVVGKAALALGDWEGGFGAFCKVLRPNDKVDARYFAHFFRTSDYRRRISSLAVGANINNLRNEHLAELRIPLPSLPEQKRIADILDQARALQVMRRGALGELDVLRDSIVAQEVRKYKYQEPLGDHLVFVTSGSRGWAKYYAGSGSRFIRSQDVLLGSIDNSDPAFVDPPSNSESKRTAIRPGDLLITITGTVGRATAAPTELGGAYISQHVAIARPGPALRSRFAESFLCSREGQSQLERAQYGQTKPGLNLTQIREFKLPVPDLATQDALVRRLESVDCNRDQLRKSEKALGSLFASLQHRAFRGEL